MNWVSDLAKLEKSIIDANGIEESKPIALALIQVAFALHRIADTQEKPKPKGAVSFTQANYAEKPDEQTTQLREIAQSRHEESR